MSFWHRLLRLPNGHDELSELKQQFSDGGRRVQEAAKKLARSAETVSRHNEEERRAREIETFRRRGVL